MIQPSPRGVLLIGHGTRQAKGTAEFFQLSEVLAAQLADEFVVRPCLLEFQKPTITEAWQSLMRLGCREVIVAPLLLFAAGHAKADIPGEVESARSLSPDGRRVAVRFARPISREPAMIQAVRDRVRETLRGEGLASDRSFNLTIPRRHGRTAVVMVGRGSRDVCASTDMRVLSETVVRGRAAEGSIAADFAIAAGGLSTTFYAMAEPRLPDTLDAVADSGNFERIIVHPHLLFSGRLYDAVVGQVQSAAQRYPRIGFDVSDYLGPSDLVAQAIAARIVRSADLLPAPGDSRQPA